MNKSLEEHIQNNLAQKLYEGNKGMYLSLLDMADAILALDLPVKFHKWITIEIWMDIDGFHHGDELVASTEEELYQYWIENILKLE